MTIKEKYATIIQTIRNSFFNINFKILDEGEKALAYLDNIDQSVIKEQEEQVLIRLGIQNSLYYLKNISNKFKIYYQDKVYYVNEENKISVKLNENKSEFHANPLLLHSDDFLEHMIYDYDNNFVNFNKLEEVLSKFNLYIEQWDSERSQLFFK